jgi:hypothetical protein
MNPQFTEEELVLSHLFTRIPLKKSDITGVSIPTDYAPSNGILVGPYVRGMETVMIHTEERNYYFYIGNAKAFVKKVEEFVQHN